MPTRRLPALKQRWSQLPIVLIAITGIGLSVLTFFVVERREHRAAEAEFAARARNVALVLQTGMNGYLEKIQAVQALFVTAAHDVTRSQFDNFAQQILAGHPAMLSVSWIPRVTRAERLTHESIAVQDGVAGYRIKTVNKDGSLSIAAENDEYFPVYYTLDKTDAKRVLGLDLRDGGPRQRPLEIARDEDRPVASQSFTLQSGDGDKRGFFLVFPVYRAGIPHDTLEERRRGLIGFVQGVFQADVMMKRIVAGLNTPIDIFLFEANSESPYALRIQSSRAAAPPVWQPGKADPRNGPVWSGALRMADATWRMTATPISTDLKSASAGWSILLAGLLVTGIATLFMHRMSRYTAQLAGAHEVATELSYTDTLTHLANRRAFLDEIARAFETSKADDRPFAVLYIDLDQFKDINDSLGHTVGDRLLEQVAARIKASVRSEDLAARLGGDEFAVLQRNVSDVEAAEALAARILDSLSAPFSIGSNELFVAASIGVWNSSGDKGTPESAMAEADLALYRAKEDGRNCVRLHDSRLADQTRERVRIGEELRGATTRGEFELYYQPQVDILTGRIDGLEALVRWNHPVRGLVPPSSFVPIAERTGAIVPLGGWVFGEACRQLRVWKDLGIAPKSLAINVSALQCRQPTFERDIEASLKTWDLTPDGIEIELTETVLMEATQHQRSVVERLRQLGFKIAIDDFGTGYSSLNYLTTYPVDRLKIAQQLVFQVTNDRRHATVVRAAIHLARDLDIEMIAEGVETLAQATFLSNEGCPKAQGYYYSRPVTAQQATDLLRAGRISAAGRRRGNGSLSVV
ncbi:EAL domain-containing protein [Roseiarcaceae bacterium H3SJ34-1]|uniref:putative bifunctional diguanylate cyclase/phosphodiesterase n=1 Tax=Terripilifer ovatus TaxID=3032367 RepID=UPI003AB94116|nr:EAL domain-containing protein [Roseiarcaceae bacterium H3SJ34-1]